MHLVCVSILAGVLLFAPGCSRAQSGGAHNGFDVSNASIPVEEIQKGGPPRDGIPSIDEPRFESVEAADAWMRPDDTVVAFARHGQARAYPLRILVWHEIVNDTVAGEPVAVTYCPLCGTAMVFDAEVAGEQRTFGVSGLLYQSDVLMYDRESESLWSQLKMEAVSGPRVGAALELLPSTHMSWRAWKNAHPDGEVLSRRTGFSRNYDRDPYAGYEATERTMFPVPGHRDDLGNKVWIVGTTATAFPVAFVVDQLPRERPLRVRAGEMTLEIRHGGESGAVEAVEIPSGEAVALTRAYWFAWQAFYPETALWRGEGQASEEEDVVLVPTRR
jgi:hypothetical protein